MFPDEKAVTLQSVGGSEKKGGPPLVLVRPAPSVVAAYIRVSSRSQDYAYQRHAIEQAARARGEAVELWFGDVATGSKMERPQLIALRTAIRAGRVRRLWVWRLDRLTRSGIVDTLSCIGEIQRAGCSVSSVADGFPLEGHAGELFMAMVAWAAQQEREKIRENQAAARLRLEASGRTWGKPPVSVATRRQVLALARDARARGERLSVRKIAKHTNCGKTTVWKILHEGEEQKAAV